MADRDTEIIAFTYFFVFLLMFGLTCVACSYVKWFRPRCKTAERKAFIDSINHGVTIFSQGSSERDRLLGDQRDGTHPETT